MSQGQLFFDTAVRPYIEPFYDLLHNTMGKLIAAGVYAIAMNFVFMETLFSTPELWWKGLSVLVFLDFAAGNFRVISDSRIRFDIHRWGKTAYKIPAYIIAVLAVSSGANMFPTSLGWLQYATFAVLSGKEIFSILRNLKMFALMSVLWEVGLSKTSLQSIEQFKKEVDERSYKSYSEHENQTFGRPRQDE